MSGAAGVTTRLADTLLVTRAADFLAAGPAEVRTLISHVCQIPMVPEAVAVHMATALFADYPQFARTADGRWALASMREGQILRSAQDDNALSVVLSEAKDLAPPVVTRPRLRDLAYAVVDVETTGTRPWQGDRVTEIAAVVVKGGEIVEVFETLVNPERPIPPWITALTRITWDMVKDAPTFRGICDPLLARLEGNVFVAHNARFDWSFVQAEVQRASGRVVDGRQLCTVKLARKLLPQLRSRSLDYVARHYGVEIEPHLRHRAAGDAIATAQVLLRLLDDACDRGCEHWDDLPMLLTPSLAKRRKKRPPAMPQPVTRDTTA